ncbi:MAG: hypothetical protein JW934_13975 [Anaerolineae bacterium]|nr:hypothetical protein [Anaerolineae bacterium]
MTGVAEMIGLIMVGYGLWYGFRGIKIHFSTDKSWWRYLSRRERYPYPAAGLLLSLVFVLAGLVFLLHFLVENATYFGYAAGIVFVLVLIIGIWQPRALHPRWYRELEDRVGKKEMRKLKAAAYEMPSEEWRAIATSDTEFSAWVDKIVPGRVRHASRGYRKLED